MNNSKVILVDVNDTPIGVVDKLEAHQKGELHRAFSIFIINENGEMLLQRRALNKYHSGGLWSNACCSHPSPEEATYDAAKRRLKEELGFEAPIEKIFDFVYLAKFENGLTEHEFDHVFIGVYNGSINFNKDEVSEIAFRSFTSIKLALLESPESFTAWFHIAFPKVEAWWNQRLSNKVA